ncbi:hypothetical protein LTS18_002388, partial [Coniosporium uncinatum]
MILPRFGLLLLNALTWTSIAAPTGYQPRNLSSRSCRPTDNYCLCFPDMCTDDGLPWWTTVSPPVERSAPLAKRKCPSNDYGMGYPDMCTDDGVPWFWTVSPPEERSAPLVERSCGPMDDYCMCYPDMCTDDGVPWFWTVSPPKEEKAFLL